MAADRFDLPAGFDGMDDPVIRMRGITKTFRSTAGEATVLKGIDVDVHRGEFISVVGRSGSGKSTLVNMLTRIDRPTSGTVQVGDVLIHELPEGRMAVWRGKNMGVVFQFFQLLPMLSLVENVMLPMDFCNIYSPASRESRALDLLKLVGLDGLAHKLPGAVAGGQQQSAAVARALANDPPILIADEPTGNLDSRTAEQVMGIFVELVEQGKTIVMVTHDQVLARRASRTLLISDGELVNEAVAIAFPSQAHSALLRLSKLASPLHLPPAAELPVSQISASAPFYLVVTGELLYPEKYPSSSLTPGAVVDSLAGLRVGLFAGPSGADLLSLPRTEVLPMLHPAADSLPPVLPLSGGFQTQGGLNLPGRDA